MKEIETQIPNLDKFGSFYISLLEPFQKSPIHTLLLIDDYRGFKGADKNNKQNTRNQVDTKLYIKAHNKLKISDRNPRYIQFH